MGHPTLLMRKGTHSGSDNPHFSVFYFYLFSMYRHFLNLVHFVGYFYLNRSHSQQLTLGLIVINCTLIAVNYCFSFLLNKMLVEIHPLPVVFPSLQPFINLIDRNKTHWNEGCSIPGAEPFCISKEEWTMNETNGCASHLYGHKYQKLSELKGTLLNDLPNLVCTALNFENQKWSQTKGYLCSPSAKTLLHH